MEFHRPLSRTYRNRIIPGACSSVIAYPFRLIFRGGEQDGGTMWQVASPWAKGKRKKERKKGIERERVSPQQLRWQIERNRVQGTSRVESASGEARSGHPPWFNATRLATILSGRKLVLLGETQPDCGSRESGNVRSGTINYSVVNFRAPPSVRRIAWAKGSFHFEP